MTSHRILERICWRRFSWSRLASWLGRLPGEPGIQWLATNRAGSVDAVGWPQGRSAQARPRLGGAEVVCLVQEAPNEPRIAVVLAGDVPEWLDCTTANVAQDLHLTLFPLCS